MKILKNSTYEGMCQEIDDGKKKIQSLTEQVSTERNKHAAALKEMNQSKEDLAKLEAENAQLKKQTAERKPQRTSNGRFAKKKDNE